MKTTFKDIVLKTNLNSCEIEKYNSKEFEEHLTRFKPCLDQISSSSLDIQKNLLRITNFNTPQSAASEAETILDCLVVENKTNIKFLIEENLTAVNSIPISLERVRSNHEELVTLCKTGEFKFLFKSSLSNQHNFQHKDLEPLCDKIVENVPVDGILNFSKILSLTQHQEFISTICCEHRLLLIVGSVHYLPYMFTLYKGGFFKELIKDVVFKLNFKKIKLFVIKPSFFVPTGIIIISGVLFNFGFTGSFNTTVLQEFPSREMLEATAKAASAVTAYANEIKFQGWFGEIVDDSANLSRKLAMSGASIISSALQGFALSFMNHAAELFTLYYESKKK